MTYQQWRLPCRCFSRTHSEKVLAIQHLGNSIDNIFQLHWIGGTDVHRAFDFAFEERDTCIGDIFNIEIVSHLISV